MPPCAAGKLQACEILSPLGAGGMAAVYLSNSSGATVIAVLRWLAGKQK